MGNFLLLHNWFGIFLCINSCICIWLWNIYWLKPAYLIMLNLTHLIAMAIRCSFIALVFCASDCFPFLNRLENILYQHTSCYQIGIDFNCVAQKSLNFELEKWMKHYTIVCRFVQSVNSSFDLIILISVGNAFISFITFFTEFMMEATSAITWFGSIFSSFLFKPFF